MSNFNDRIQLRKGTQKSDIIEYLKEHGSITRLEAINELGIIELPARISELEKEGFRIPRQEYTGISRRGRKYTSMRYLKPRGWA